MKGQAETLIVFSRCVRRRRAVQALSHQVTFGTNRYTVLG